MKVLVTGGSGFIGSHLVDKLIAAGHSVVVFDLKPPQRRDVKYVRGNLLSLTDIDKAMKGIEVVFHFAAFSNIDLIKDNPVDAVSFNVMGTTNLLEACRKRKIFRFVLASSVFVFNENGHLYTASKYASELICKSYNVLFGVPYTIIRCGTVYGPRSRHVDVISIFIEKCLKGEALTVKGSGNQKRNFIYVEDLAEGCVKALGKKGENKTYVIAGKEMVSINDLIAIFKKIMPDRLKVSHQKGRVDDYAGEILGNNLIKKELGWQPKTSLVEGVKKTFNKLKGESLC
jgi:UDP-glucose 4-epimerase